MDPVFGCAVEGVAVRIRRSLSRIAWLGLDGSGDSCDSAGACSGGSHDASCSLR